MPVSQAESLIRAMNRLGKTQAEFESYLYEGGGHNPVTLEDSFVRALVFLLPLASGS